jgi:hypothetical protein
MLKQPSSFTTVPEGPETLIPKILSVQKEETPDMHVKRIPQSYR